MQIPLGKDYFAARNGENTTIYMDTSKLINGHMFIVGASGVGKSHTIRKLISSGIAQSKKVRFHVFDVHGDLDIEGASTVLFSAQTPYGLDVLKINPDPHFGGVRNAIQNFIFTINQASAVNLGIKQEAVIRDLLKDVYKDYGFEFDDPSTWSLNSYETRLVSGGADNRLYLEVSIQDKDEAKGYGARWDPERKLWWVHTENYKGQLTKWKPAFKPRTYPTLNDLVEYTKRVYEALFLGTDQKGVRAVSDLNKAARAYQKKLLANVKELRYSGIDAETQEALNKARENSIEAYTRYANAVQTGFELDTLLKYDPESLKSVYFRLNNLLATGLFKQYAPPFDDGVNVWRYKLDPLRSEEKKMFVFFTLQEIFARAVQRGQLDEVVEVVVLDELGVYTSSKDDEGGDGIIGVIAREARKFGLALWAANQSPEKVPESLIASVATTVILGIHEKYWKPSVDKLRIELKLLEWIKPQSTIAVQLKEKRALRNRWWWVQL